MPYNLRSRDNLKPRKRYYEEAKTRHEVMVTPTGWEGLKALATAHGLSASEFIEQVGRGVIGIDSAQDDGRRVEP